ncbi:MAG: regulatory protein RecX [Pseudomonadota bacterium]
MDDPVEAAYAQALKLLARREHGRAELARKLTQRGFTSDAIGPALLRLEAAGYLSDTRYAQARVAELRRRRYGPLRAQAELRAQDVDGAVIADVVQADDRDWYRVCREAAGRRSDASPASPAERARLQRQLMTRGFTAAQIRAALGKDDSDDA